MALPGEQVQVPQPVADAPAPELANANLPACAPGAQQEVNIPSFNILSFRVPAFSPTLVQFLSLCCRVGSLAPEHKLFRGNFLFPDSVKRLLVTGAQFR